ncbi:MAG: acetoacetate decarboxylase family protein [Acidimicrobiia bacterium]|nr:acetoacetate decarboxylase family protein [Acidimicrobiia bacterium]
MRDTAFFDGIAQIPDRRGGRDLKRPVFFYDSTMFQVSFLTPIERIRELLPSHRIHPMRFTPKRAVTSIGAVQHHDSDVGAYNVLGIMFPVTIDHPAPLMRGLLKVATEGATLFAWQMPETSEFAVESGVETAGYPKFLADVDIDTEGDWATCRVEEGGRQILNLSIRRPSVVPVHRRWPAGMLTVRDGWVQRIPYVSNIPYAGKSSKAADVGLELGDHPVADELRHLDLGRPVNIQYFTGMQQTLGTVLEAWPADHETTRWTPTSPAS